VIDGAGRSLNHFTGDLCSLTYLEGNFEGNHPRWRNLYYSRPECYYHYPSPLDLRKCISRHKIKAIIFIGDSILRSLYAAFMDLLDLSVNEASLKKSHGIGGLKQVEGTAIDFMEYWFPNQAKQIQGRFTRLCKSLNLRPGDTIVIVVNIGIMHTLPGACNDGNGFMKGLDAFKPFLESWAKDNHANTEAGPTVRGIVYGAPSVLGLRSSSVSMAKGLKMTEILKARLASNATVPKNPTSPFPFATLDMEPLSHARFDATEDGFHYGQSLRVTQAIGLTNMICNGPDDFLVANPLVRQPESG